MIKIDEEKCKKCSACYDVCRAYVFSKNSQTKDGRVTVAEPENCIRCGYCISVCPTDAISSDELAKSQFKPLPKVTIDPQGVENLIFKRRSTRRFKEQVVPREDIERLIEVAIHAGTATNFQLENIMIIQDRKYMAVLEEMVGKIFWNNLLRFFKDHGLLANILSKICGKEQSDSLKIYHKIWKAMGDFNGKIFYGAPLLIVIHGLKSNKVNQANCAIAIRNIELMAEAMGLGTCWCGWLMGAATVSGKINKFLGLDRSRQIGGALMVGYPKYQNRKKVPRNQRDIVWI